jgi:integrase
MTEADIVKALVEEKKVSASTAGAYIKSLRQALNVKQIKNLIPLKDVEKVMGNISKYANSTKKAILGAICSVLKIYNTPVLRKAHTKYYDEMMKLSKEAKEKEGTNEMTDKQKEAWESWDSILAKQTELGKSIEGYDKKKTLDVSEYNKLLDYIVLSLYVDIPARRNKDFLLMKVVKSVSDKESKDFNYLDLSKKEFVFLNYKTNKTYSKQIQAISEILFNKISLYLKHHPTYKDASKRKEPIHFLQYADGRDVIAINGITRILNSIFKKKISSSMLRHIFISHTFGDVMDKMKETATEMGHSIGEQRAYYVKNDVISHE